MRIRLFLLGLGLVAASITAATATAGNLEDSASSCSSQVLEQPFKRWLDPAKYFLVPGGSFEDGAPGWQLKGSSVVDGNESFVVHGAKDDSSLSIPNGASATTPAMCVTLLHPDLRFFVRNKGSLLGVLRVDVLVDTPLGVGHAPGRRRRRRARPGRRRCRCRSSRTRSRCSARTARPRSPSASRRCSAARSRSTTSTSIRIAARDAGTKSRPRAGVVRGRVQHLPHGHELEAAEHRPARRDRPGRGAARLRLPARGPARRLARRRRADRARPSPARDARRARADVRQVRPAALDAARTSSRRTSSPSCAASRTTCARSRSPTSSA